MLLRKLAVISVLCISIARADWGWIDSLKEDVNEFLRSGTRSDNFNLAVDLFRFKNPYDGQLDVKFFDLLSRLGEDEKRAVSCAACESTVGTAMSWWEAGDSRDEIVDKWAALCEELQAGTPRMCRGSAELHVDMAVWILDTKNKTQYPMTAADACGFFSYPECGIPGDQYQWTLDLDFLGPKPTPEDPQIPPEGSPTLKVLQITDVHTDPNYLAGGNAECDEKMCCRYDQGVPFNSSSAAGYWGDYRHCDTPLYAYTDMLQAAAAQHPDVSYVIFTGDIVDHAGWTTSEQYNRNLITFAISEIGRFFPSVPVIPILGNHEAHPSNVFADPLRTEIPANLSTAWLFELSVDLWSQWLPPSTSATILEGGMYVVDLSPGLTIIGINSMACLSYNWWLMYDNVDPYNQLMWLAERLLEAETNGRKVHILAHVPSGFDDCMTAWSTQYRRIIDRFENTVVAQFHGHTHRDQFHVFYDLADPSRPTNVAFTAGSGTAYNDVNPNYRLYLVDGEHPESSYRVLDHETWYFNLTEANLAGESVPPNWQKLYSFNDAYGTTSLFPAEMDELVQRMAQDTSLQQQYFEFYWTLGDTSLQTGCDVTCLENLVCGIVTTVNTDKSKCVELFPPKFK